MKTTAIEQYWRKQASVLPQMAQAIVRELPSICLDPGPILQAANLCRANLAKGQFFYAMDDLHFRIKSTGHTPSHAPKEINIFLSVRAKSDNNCQAYDPFNLLELNVVLRAGKSNEFLGAWHLDRHVGETEEPVNSLHPLYHFHFGGHQLKELNDDVGRLLILDSPRLPHYPMDIFLGIDFVLSHFDGEAWAKMKDNTRYLNFLKTSQDFLIASHIRSLNTHYEKSPDERKHGGACCLLPNLLPH